MSPGVSRAPGSTRTTRTDRAPEVLAELARRGVDDASASTLTRSLYASDASIYRIAPLVVARPRHVDEVAAVLDVARATGVPLTMRGAGTSIAGNAVGAGIVLDTSRHLNRVLSLDAEARTAVVEPGTVHAVLQAQATRAGLRFGPDPSTHTRCTVGGMVGNNACGSRALGYGRTSDNVVALEALAADGRPVAEHAPSLLGLAAEHLGTIRPRFGQFTRQVSGYALEQLLPERGGSVDRFLVGSEGTLAVVTQATVRLVEDAPVRVLAVLGYPSMADAADAVPALLAHGPVACEGIDDRITSLVPGHPELPPGRGWLLVELTGATEAEALARADRVVADGGALGSRVVVDVVEQLALWRIREDGAGLASRTTDPPGQPGWEDAAVPPERLGDYLRAFDALLEERGFTGAPYGHFGDGCVHIRIDFALSRAEGRTAYRSFVEEAARLAASYGGSLSGEHGDGRARSELLPLMYDEPALALFREVKRLLDPDALLNPGVLVDPAPLDADVRLAGVPAQGPRPSLALVHDGGDLSAAVHRCTGVGKCLADTTKGAGIMCPSFQATRDEKDSTRGRARTLQDAVSGRLPGGLSDPAVHDALDLCLACKGCARDCPTGVDMATYKAEALHQRYAGRLRPLSHYTLGRLPQLMGLAPTALARLGLRVAPRLAAASAGVDTRRSLPLPARRPLSRQARRARVATRPDVVVWADTFTNRFTPQVAEAAVRVLEAAGESVAVHARAGECCGLTLVSTGQLDAARRTLGSLLETLRRYEGVPVVVLEPSCLAVLRHDAADLLGADAVPTGVRSLAEHLAALDWAPPSLDGVEVVAQPHCHHASVVGWEADAALLRRAGAALTRVGGCCGLAGNFGMEKGHYEVSVKVFEHDLGPAVRAAGPDAVVLTDGFSCRTQLDDLGHTVGAGPGRSVHLAELLASRL